MKKFSTRFASIILSLILVISSLPLTVLSVSAADGDAATTNLTASDVAYCGIGVGIDSNNKNCVRFPEQGYTAIKHCEFTFTGTVSNGEAVGTFSSDALGYTKYVNISLGAAKEPLKTTAETLTVAFDTGINGTASVVNNNNTYLFFRDEEYGKDYGYMFDRIGKWPGTHTQTAFSFFVRESGNTTSGINGYKRVQSIDEIKPGEKYLIAHPGKYDTANGNAADGSAWYVLHPSKSDTNYVQVAKVYNTILSATAKRLQNGSFEYNADGSQYAQTSGNHQESHIIQAWNTTAEENKVELFDKNSKAHMDVRDPAKNYIPDGKYAAELNADEPGSLYQVVNTLPSSTYLWGLDHRGRMGTDTMALVIGPSQDVRPSKNSGSTTSETTSDNKKKFGKDQFMQMVEWAKSQRNIELLSDYSDTSGNYGRNTNDKRLQNITVYSKPFGLNGSFKSSDELSPFSLVPTDEHTEEWHIWIMISGSGDWSSYGSNDKEISAGQTIVNSYGNIDSSVMTSEELKQFFYRVPAGQSESVFAFVPIDTAYQHRGNNTNVTLGNLLDNVNFEVFNSFTASSTDHGTGSITNTDNGSVGEQNITKSNPISVYTKDNSTQNLVAAIKKEDEKDVTFAGIYLTTQDANGESVTVFKPLKGYEIDERELKWQTDPANKKLQTATVTLPNGKQAVVSKLETDKGDAYDIPADMWLKRTDDTGNVAYVMQLKNVSSSMDAHFIFLKSPTVTYDANSTEKYQYEISSTDKSNVYSFKPQSVDDGVKYIDPVSSHNPVAPNDGWKFTGWKLFDADGVVKDNNGNEVILSGTNAIACNTKQPKGKPYERKFIVVDGKTVEDAFNEGADVTEDGNTVIGKEWSLKPGVTFAYEKESEALSLVAQWRFKNTFIPEYQDNVADKVFTQGEAGGTIELKNTNSENYTADQNGTKSYFAGVEEQVVATAKANQYYTFIGWYDSKGNVVTTNPELIVNQIKGEIGEYHARFQKTGVAVNFYYLEYNESTKSYEYNKVYDGGKHNQYLNKNDKAAKPTNDSKNVKTWYTSPTNLGADTAFDFSQTLSNSIDLYAAPTFTFNYLNQFQFAEPWRMITYATLKYDGKYIDMKNDPDVTGYKVYILKAGSADEVVQPTSAQIKANSNTKVVSKDDPRIMFDGTTKVDANFNRIGTTYNNLHIFDMKTPVWVTFEFTYRGITYTANVKDRSLYNNINMYMASGNPYYTEYSEQQKDVLNAIKAMYDATAPYKISKATEYKSSVSVSNEVKTNVKVPDEGYTFNSSTTIRNIEPWGFKYSFSVKDKSLSEYDDYGVVVLSDYEQAPANASELVNNEKAVMYSKSGNNIYSVEGDANTAVAYHVNGITIANYDKSAYAVFFVKDSSGYHYSQFISNSYKAIAKKDTSDSKEVSTAILNYAQKYRTYVDAISKKNN